MVCYGVPSLSLFRLENARPSDNQALFLPFRTQQVCHVTSLWSLWCMSHSSDKEMNMTPQNPEHLAFLFQVLNSLWFFSFDANCSSLTFLVCLRALHVGHNGGVDQPFDCDDVGHLPEDPGKQPSLAAPDFVQPSKNLQFPFPATIWCGVEVWPGQAH